MIQILKNRLRKLLKNTFFILLVWVFIFKGIIYATYITPPFIKMAPDDVGHLSYIQYIYEEKEIPVLGNTLLGDYIQNLFNNEAKQILNNEMNLNIGSYYFEDANTFENSDLNWIAQHPPLYYTLATVIYAIANVFTTNVALLIIAIRFLSIMMGAITLFYLKNIVDILEFNPIVKKMVV